MNACYNKNELEINDNSVDIMNPFGKNKILIEEEFELEVNLTDSEIIVDLNVSISEQVSIHENNNDSRFNNKIEIDNQVFYKSNIISNIIHAQTKLSKNRNLRVFGIDKDLFSVDDSVTCDLDNSNSLLITDLLVTILHNTLDNRYCLTLLSIDKIFHQTVPSTSVSIDFINECSFTATILRIESIKNVSFVWSGVYDEQVSDIKGALCCPIKSSIAFNEEKTILYR